MLTEGRIPMEAGEHQMVEEILAMHPGESATITRRDPGESGPLLVHMSDRTYLVERKSN